MNGQRHILVFPVSLWNGMAGTRRVRVLVDELAAAGCYTFSNLMICHPAEYSGRTEVGTANDIPFCRIGYRYYNVLSWVGFWYAGYRFVHQMRRHGQPNVLYCYQETDLVTLPVLLAARWLGYKIMVDIVEDNALLNEPVNNWLARLRVHSGVWLLNRLPLYADAAIAISGHLLQRTKRLVNGRIPVSLIPISVNLSAFPCPSATPKTGMGNRPLRVFYGGSFGAKDGLAHLLRAVHLCLPVHPGMTLVLTGTGSVTDMDEFRSVVNQLQIGTAIDYRGYLSDDAYVRTMQSCDVFCMTRTRSSFANAGFPFKLGEMLATGKPVIATRVGDVGTYLVDFESALLVEPEEPEQIADRLLWVVDHYPQALAMGERGKGVAEQHFSASRVARQLNGVFDELLHTT